MIFFAGTAREWMNLSEQQKKDLTGSVLVLQKQKKAAARKQTV